jgi:hypothetical protein
MLLRGRREQCGVLDGVLADVRAGAQPCADSPRRALLDAFTWVQIQRSSGSSGRTSVSPIAGGR